MHTHTPPSRGSGAVDEDIDVGKYLSVLRPYLLRLGVAAMIGAAAAVTIALISPREYEAETSLAVSRSKLTEGLGETTAVANFMPFITNRGLAGQIIKEFGLEKPPYSASPTTLFGSVVNVSPVRNSTVIVVSSRMFDPSLAAKVVNRIGELATDAVRSSSQQEAVQARDYIKVQTDDARARFEQSALRLREFREASQVELVKKDVEAALTEREGLLKLLMNIQGERSGLAAAEAELKSRPRVDVTKRAIDSDPAMVEAARNGGATNVLPLQLRTEEISPVYNKLDEKIAVARAKLASLEGKRSVLRTRNLDDAKLQALTALYRIEETLTRLEVERDVAEKVYQQMVTSYETARLTVAGRSSALQVVAAAVPPDVPVSRQVGRKALLGAVLGLLVALTLIVAWRTFRESPKPAV